MKKAMFIPGLLFTSASLFLSLVGLGQTDKASRPSPPAEATGKVNEAKITINYSSPAVKGRQIWGAIVPYNKVWRAGANEATLFETSKDIMVEGKPLLAGKYSLFATPTEKEWTIIFNAQTGQWGDVPGGAANCNLAKNVLTVNVTPVKSSILRERLKYEVTEKGFILSWENLEVPVSIK